MRLDEAQLPGLAYVDLTGGAARRKPVILLGHAEDSVEILLAAVAYLQRWS